MKILPNTPLVERTMYLYNDNCTSSQLKSVVFKMKLTSLENLRHRIVQACVEILWKDQNCLEVGGIGIPLKWCPTWPFIIRVATTSPWNQKKRGTYFTCIVLIGPPCTKTVPYFFHFSNYSIDWPPWTKKWIHKPIE